MQFESLSKKKKDIYLRNRYLHELYSMILDNIHRLNDNNIKLENENKMMVYHCIDIDYNGRYLNYDYNRLQSNKNIAQNSLTKDFSETKKINYEKVSSTLESIINEETLENNDIFDSMNENKNENNNNDNNKNSNSDNNNKNNNKSNSNNTDVGITTTTTTTITNNNSNNNNNNNNFLLEKINNKDNYDYKDIEFDDELKLNTEELLEQTKIEFDNNNNNIMISSNSTTFNDISNNNNDKDSINTDEYDNIKENNSDNNNNNNNNNNYNNNNNNNYNNNNNNNTNY